MFQVCLGTEIYSNGDNTFKADISIQKAQASNKPNEDEVVLIYDAKYSKTNSTITIGAIKAFSSDVLDFSVPKEEAKNLIFNEFKFFKNNCLITNGKVNSLRAEFSKRKNIVQVGRFSPDHNAIEL